MEAVNPIPKIIFETLIYRCNKVQFLFLCVYKGGYPRHPENSRANTQVNESYMGAPVQRGCCKRTPKEIIFFVGGGGGGGRGRVVHARIV